MDIKQDPNSIPNFNGGGRVGELQPDEPEQQQSSVQLDPGAEGDGAVGEAQQDTGRGATAKPRQVGAGTGAAAGSSDANGARPDPSTTGAGAIDGLVGAP